MSLLSRIRNIFKYDVPSRSDALFWLTGRILLSGGNYYFFDKSGNGRHFLITGYDFDADWNLGMPYKTAATISAPVGDAVLIAADINNYLYDSGGTPNEIPVVSLFQNVDYADKLFCRHKAQVLDVNGVEIYQPRVIDIVLYGTVKTGADLIACNSFFGVPAEITSNVRWVDPVNGLDTNDGTKLAPYKTFQRANNQATTNDTIYIKTGLSDETGYLTSNKILEFKGIGRTEITSSGTTYVLLTQLNGAVKFNGIIFNGETDTTNVLYLYRTLTEISRCLLKGAATIDVLLSSVSGLIELKNLVLNSKKLISAVNSITIDSCYSIDYFSTIPATCQQFYLINSKFITDIVGLNFMVSASPDIPVRFEGNNIKVTTCSNWLSFVSGTAINAFTFLKNKVQIDAIVSTAFGNINHAFSSIKINDNTIINNSTKPIFVLRNNIDVEIKRNIIDSYLYSAYPVYNTENIATDVVIANNLMRSRHDEGHNIEVGSESSSAYNDTFNSILIENNKLLNNKLYNPSNTVTLHSIFVGFQGVPTQIRYNNSSYAGMEVLKGSDSDYSLCDFKYNLIHRNQFYGLYCKSVNGVKIINNTFYENGDAELYFTDNIASDGCSDMVIKNNVIVNTTGLLINMLTASCAVNHTIDYNCYYSTIAKPFSINGVTYSFAEWQALGYDAHSVFQNPNLDSNLIPLVPIEIGENLDVDYDYGLDISTNWGDDNHIPSIVTKQQSTNWQVGAYVQ